jgi:hypothetical protein
MKDILMDVGLNVAIRIMAGVICGNMEEVVEWEVNDRAGWVSGSMSSLGPWPASPVAARGGGGGVRYHQCSRQPWRARKKKNLGTILPSSHGYFGGESMLKNAF